MSLRKLIILKHVIIIGGWNFNMIFDILSVSPNVAVFYDVIIILLFILIIGLLLHIKENQIQIKMKIKVIRNLLDSSRFYEKPVNYTLIIFITLLLVILYKFIDFLSLYANSILVVITALYVIFTYEIVRQGFQNQKIQLNDQKIVFLERRLELLYYPLERDLKNAHDIYIAHIVVNFHNYLYLSTIRLNTLINDYQDKTVKVADFNCKERSDLETQYRQEILKTIEEDVTLFKDELYTMINEKY
ncbi:MAG: hypothetical protein PHT13_08570 [Methanosarcina sp.]|nr:hypothetical protein [Methanosarcina sp.]